MGTDNIKHEQNSTEMMYLPVKCEHAACDGHVHRHLSGHPTNHKHLLSRVGVEGGVVDVLGSPELVFRQPGFYNPSPDRVNPVELPQSYNYRRQ